MSYQREYEKTIKIGIVGAGDHMYRNLLPCMTFLPVEIKAICAKSNQARLKKTAKQYGIDNTYNSPADMYKNENLDGVIICVSPALHPKLTIEALNAGLHVWLEKPPAMRASEIQDMIDARKDRIAVVGFKKVFMPCIKKVRELVSNSDAGKLITMLAEYRMDIPENGEHILKEGKFTNWLGNGCHPLSIMMSVGGKVKAVTTHRGENGGGVFVLEFENGALGNFHLSEGLKGSNERYVFYTENYQVTVDNSLKVSLDRGIPEKGYGLTTNYAPEGTNHGTVSWEPQNTVATLENKQLFTQGMYDELKHFCDCVLENKPATEGTLEFALEIMKVYEAGLLSNGNRKPVK